jgi:hypothetical protein
MATTVNLLMFLPLNDLKVVVTLYAVETNHLQQQADPALQGL